MDSPEVSIVIPTQGTRASLAAALRSALAQDFPAFEVVVVDDAVTDRTWRTRRELAPLLADPRVRLVEFHRSIGCAAAKNAGLNAARGEWVCYLDDDNEYRPGKLRAQHALATATTANLVLCGLEIRAGGRRRQRQVDAREFANDAQLLDTSPDTNVLFHRRLPEPRWDEALGTVDDACFFHAFLAAHGESKVPNAAQPLVIYHAHTADRANVDFLRHYRGQRRLIVRWAPRFSREARRVLLLRVLVSLEKFRPGRWRRLLRWSGGLLRVGGLREWRVVANAVGVKLPVIRRWMVT